MFLEVVQPYCRWSSFSWSWSLSSDDIKYSLQAKERICRLIQSGVDSGAKLLLDGRNILV